MKTFTILIVAILTGNFVICKDNQEATPDKRGISNSHRNRIVADNKKLSGNTVKIVTQTVALPVSKPYPVTVERKVPIPVPHKVPVEVPRPVEVPVPHPVPIQITKPYPVYVNKPIPVIVPEAVPIPQVQRVPVAVPQRYPITVEQAVPVKVPQPVVVPDFQPIYVRDLKSSGDNVASETGFNFGTNWRGVPLVSQGTGAVEYGILRSPEGASTHVMFKNGDYSYSYKL